MANRPYGNSDEWPWFTSTAGGDIAVAATEVTNVHFEAFQPAHAALRGKYGFSTGDNEAAVFITWYDAAEYAVWLSDQLNATVRLPTESEAEAYIRSDGAGGASSTYYYTGPTFPYGKNQCDSWWPGGAGRNDSCDVVVNLTVANFPPSPAGLYDVTGNVEEWTSSWYDYYASGGTGGAAGGAGGGDGTGLPFPLPGTFKVTRGGSHSADVYHLRSTARVAMLPADNSWYVGIRLVREAAPGNRARDWLRAASASCVLAAGDRATASLTASAAGAPALDCSPRLREAPVSAVYQHWRPLAARAAAAGEPVPAAPPQHGSVWAELDLLHEPAVAAAAGRSLRKRAQRRQARGKTAHGPAVAAAAPSPAPWFAPPLQFVHVDSVPAVPFTQHNHDPALALCPNGDVVATWFSTITEPGRESGIATSRLRLSSAGNASAPLAWEPARLFFKTPGRMDCCPIMFYDDASGVLMHIHGVSAAATWGNTALVQRESTDCGESWGPPRIVAPEHYLHHQPITSFFRCGDGRLAFASDNTTIGSGGTVLHFSADGGQTWSDTWNANGQYALGIHAGIVQLANGSFLAFGRGNDISGMMAQSRSDDGAATWAYSASPFPGIVGGQRPSHLKLEDGTLLFCSFANAPMPVPTACGAPRNVTGLYCAVSYDGGNSWPNRRLVSEDAPGALREQLDGVLYVATPLSGEQDGYTVARQGPDGTVHLLTSRNHYRFNAAWLGAPAPC